MATPNTKNMNSKYKSWLMCMKQKQHFTILSLVIFCFKIIRVSSFVQI